MHTTIAIVTRNRSTHLKRCLTSITKQTVRPYAVLIVDNGSTDHTKQVVQTFTKKLPIHYVLEPTIGIPYARNTALKHAKGDIIAFTDDDCEVAPDWIEQIQSKHKQYPNVIAIQGWSVSYPKDSAISIVVHYNYSTTVVDNLIGADTANFLLSDWPILTLHTKNVSLKLAKIRLLDVHFKPLFKPYNSFEDTDFAKQLLSRGQHLQFCPSILAIHWERPTFSSFIRQRFLYGKGAWQLYQQHWPHSYFPQKNLLDRAKRVRAFLFYCFNVNTQVQFIMVPQFMLILKLATFWGRTAGFATHQKYHASLRIMILKQKINANAEKYKTKYVNLIGQLAQFK